MDISSGTDTALLASSGLAYGQARASASALSVSGKGDLASQKKAASNFEAMFLSQMFGHMFEGLKSDNLFGGGHGEEMFRSLLVDEYAKQVVKKGGIGIADQVMRTLISHQEKA